MVSKNELIQLAQEQATFYTHVINSSKLPGDVHSAKYGLQEAQNLLLLLDKREEPTKSDLKTIYSILMSMTRGVEGFMDYETERRKREIGKKIYYMMEEIEYKVGWK